VKTLIIAEVGVNHNGDMSLAKKLIEIAASAGADLVKFQSFSADRLVTFSASKAKYQLSTEYVEETQHEMLRKLELTESMHYELLAHCKSHGIGFFSTGFDTQSIDLLIELGQNKFKIPSGELTNYPFLQYIGKLNREVILSTGMSNFDEIGAALEVLESAGTPRSKITVLHCTTAYPVPIPEVNLLAMKKIQEKFEVRVGYSDHTLGIEIPLAAVALGAQVIEKHFTIDRTLSGPDHKASLEPHELATMIQGIRRIELALGDGEKKLMPCEASNIEIARRSIVASRHIKSGETFTEENVTTKRPGTGISPMKLPRLLGTYSTREYFIDEIIDEA
jgi:N,N'-diacetyllegionaminate synthase